MDGRILKAVLCSCESVMKDIDKSDEYQNILQKDQFLPKSDIIFNALCSSLTKLLCYKVSKEAYQRYIVRLHVIDALRDWCRITDTLKNFRVFTNEEKTLAFVKKLLEKYLTDDFLDNCGSDDCLVSLTSALVCLASKDSYYKRYIEKLLLRLSQLQYSNESSQLLCYTVQRDSNLNLNLSTVEDIYYSQRFKLIEEPLLNNFLSMCTDLNKDNNTDNTKSVNLIDQLYEFASMSPFIFQVMCSFSKELLEQLDYAPAVLNFIQLLIKHITEHCENQDKNILDLYPKDLQSCVILLRIEPASHTKDSKDATFHRLEEIYVKDKDNVIILLSHFPMWLKIFGEHFTKSLDRFQ